MKGYQVSATPQCSLRTPSWRSGPLVVARTRRARRVGLKPAPGPLGLLIRCRSVHTVGMKAPLAIVALDGAGVVVWAGVVRPGRVVCPRRAVWFVETLPGTLPRIGESAELEPMLAPWPAP